MEQPSEAQVVINVLLQHLVETTLERNELRARYESDLAEVKEQLAVLAAQVAPDGSADAEVPTAPAGPPGGPSAE